MQNSYILDKEKARSRYKEAFINFREDFFKAINEKIFAISNITYEREAYPDMLLSLVLVEDLNENITKLNEFFPSEKVRSCIFNEFLASLAKNLILNRTYNWPDCQKCSDATLWECQKLFLNLFHLDSPYLAEMIKLIWDADRNYYKVNNIDDHNQRPFGMEIIPSKERAFWINSLQIGNEIDAIKTEPVQGKQIWSRAEILLIKEKIYVRFLEESDDYNCSFSPNYEIASYASHSLDWDWRKSLEIGDEIDVCDPSNVWYSSTILSKRTRKQNDKNITEIYFGYRVFREEADKIDTESGKSYYGWSCKFDEWINIHNPRVQPFNKLAKKTLSLISSNNEIFDDSNDLIFDEDNAKDPIFGTQHKFAISRQKICKSSSLILWVNTLGSMGLFDKILARIIDTKNWCPIDFLSNLLLALGNLHGLFYRKFALDYLQKILEGSMKNILESPESNFRNFSKDKIEGVISGLEKIIKRLYPLKERYDIVENFTLNVARICFKSSILERKIQGLKMIQEIIKNIKYQDFKSITYKDLGVWLETNNIFDELYGSSSHSQLIQRSSEFLRFLINEELITLDHLTIIWKGINNGDIQTKLSIYKMISDLSVSFNAKSVDFFVDRISEIEIEKLTKDDVDLLYELARFFNKGGDFAIKALNFLWKILGSSKTKISKELFDFVMEKTGDLVGSYYLKDYRLTIIERCIKNIEDNYGVFPSLKILNKALGAYPEKVMGHFTSVQTSKAVICEDLVTRCNIIEILFKNLASFKAYLRDKLKNIPLNDITESILNKFIKDHIEYLEHITERVLTLQNIIKSLPDENPLKHSFSLLSRLWDEIVEKYLFPQEQNVLFRWIKEFCDFEKETSVNDFSETLKFLNEKMLAKSKLVSKLSMDGLICFKSMFLSVNRHLKKIEIISKVPEKEEYNLNFTNMGPKDASGNNSCEEKIVPRILALVEPEELEGIGFLWDSCLENSDEDVSNKAIEFLIELYMNNFKSDEDFIVKIRKSYIQKCFSMIETCTKLKKNNENELWNRKIIRSITAINSFLDESEKAGIGNLKSHNANVKGEYMTVSVYNDNITSGSSVQKNLELKMSSNDTLYGLRLEVAKLLQTSWESIRLIRSSSGRELKDKENGWTLGELRVKNGEKFQGKRRQTQQIPEANLLLSDGSMNPRFLKIVKNWFDIFSTNEKMSPDQCANFTNSCIRSSSNEISCNASDKKIRELFEKWDDDNDGYLSLENFISFYQNAAYNRPKHVWYNLAAYHYRNDLRKENEVEQGEIDIKLLPRYLLSQSAEYYHILFNLIEEKGRIADDVWRLLNRLPTSPVILKKVINLEGVKTLNDPPNWQLLLDIENNYLLLYCLNVFEYLMEDQCAKEYQLESDHFRTEFIKFGGFEHLFKIFKVYNNKNRNLLSFLDKNILNFILKIIKNYMIAALCNKIPGLYKMMQLIKIIYINLDYVTELMINDPLITKEAISTEDKRVETARKKLEESLEHKQLAEKLAGELGDKILETIDLVSFKDGLILLGLDILTKESEDIESEERVILELVLILLLGIYLYSKENLLSLVAPGKHEQFFLHGLFCYKSQIIRKNFNHAFFILIREKKEVLGGYYIKLLLENLPDGSINERRECIHFYEVLCKLLEECHQSFEFHYDNLATQMITSISLHQSQETRSKPYPDNILLGYLNLLEKVLELNPELRIKHSKFAFDLFEEGLFDINRKDQLYKEEYLYELENKTSEKDLFNNYVKCKSPQTRRSAYKIIARYVKNNSDLFECTLEKCVIPLLKIAPRTDKTWNFSPMFNGRSTSGYVGIRNLGCICYMTAMIQQFFMNEPFRYALLRACDNVAAKNVPYMNNPKLIVDDNILHQMQKMFVFLELTDRQDYNPFEFCFSFKDYGGQPVNVLIQQDAQEFLNMIFEKLEHSLHNSPFSQVLENVYGGKYCNQMICTNCKNVTNRYETFYNLSLQVKNMKNIFESLNKYIAGETISDYTCENCRKKVEITKRCVLSSLPNVLIIHLQRLVFNLDTFLNEKINSRLEFPYELNMQPFLKDELEKKEKEKESETEKEKENAATELARKKSSSFHEDILTPSHLVRKGSLMPEEKLERESSSFTKNVHEKEYFQYKLKGVVNHTGSAEAGHYYSFINLVGNKWLELNDSVIRDFDIKQLEVECFGGTNGYSENTDDYWSWEGKENAKSAYILVYERQMKEPFVLKLGDDQNVSNLATIADLEKKPIEGSNNYTVDYYDMKRYIPENHYELVWNDNHEFMLEKHIYNEDFFKFIFEFFNNFPSFPFKQKDIPLPDYYTNHDAFKTLKPLIAKSAELILQYISEILYKANDKNTINDITKIVRGLLLLIPDEALGLAENYLFLKQKEIFELLLSCSELGVRTSAEQILITFISVISEHNKLFTDTNLFGERKEIYEKVTRFLTNLLNLLPQEVGKNWTKFQQYFDFWRHFASLGKSYIDFLNSKEFIASLIDFFLEKKSPLVLPGQAEKRQKMGNQYQKPPFESILQCLQILISEDLDVTKLSEKEKLCLNCKEFYEKVVEEKYSYHIISNIVLKSAYENPTLTKDLSFIILKGVNRVAFDDVDPYLHLMNSLLSIQDSLQEQRFEQILGYPQLIFNKYENYGLYEGLEQQYFSYESTLPWSDENISLLNYIYQNKKKWEVLCSVCLGKMLQMLDENDKVLKYVAGMPGPSYIYDSYFNWIKPFVLDFIEEAKKMNYPKYSQEKIEKGNEILKSYHSIEKKLEERYKKIESSKGEITSFLSDYEPLIIGKNIKEKKISEEILYKKRDDVISLIIIETQVYAVDSDPNTFTNLSFPAQSLDRNEFQSREIHPDSSFFKMVNSYFWDESRRRKLLSKKETPPLKVEENPFNDEEEQELKESKIYPDLGNNEEFTRKKSNSEQHKKKSKLTIEVPQEKINAENQKEDYKESLSYEVVENVAKEEKLKNYPLINLPLKEVNCIRRYILRNDTLENIKFELKFNNNPKNINVFFPQAISKKIHMKSTQVIVSLLKKKYEEDWPKNVNYETSLEFTDLLSNANDQNKYQNQSNLSINTRVIPYANTYPADDYNYNNALDDYPRGGIEEYSKTNVPGKKCQLCDVVNDPNNEKCSFCEAAI